MNAPPGADGRSAPPDQGPHPLNLSRFPRIDRPRPILWRTTLARLCATLTRFRVHADKATGPLWSAAAFRPGSLRRCNASVQSIACVVLDVDGGWTIGDATARWGQWLHIVHTTWSHTAADHKFRLVLPLAAPAPVDRWGEVFAGAQAFSGGHLDPSTKDAARVWFLPSVPHADAPRAAFVNPGPLAPWWWFAGHAPPPPAAPLRHWVATSMDAPAMDADEVASLLGATFREPFARFVTCPRCGDASIWFRLPNGRFARCNHRDTCGWYGSLADLLRSHGHVVH